MEEKSTTTVTNILRGRVGFKAQLNDVDDVMSSSPISLCWLVLSRFVLHGAMRPLQLRPMWSYGLENPGSRFSS